MARTGKIARLPLVIREELNMRLRENENGQTLLDWLNSLPQCQDAPINDANLSLWRQGGFAEWLDDQERVHKIEKLSELSLRLAKASGGNLSEGLLAIAAGKLQEALEAGCDVEIDEASGKEVVNGVSVDKLTAAVAKIRAMEIEAQKLEVKKIEVGQKGQALDLETKKFNHLRVKAFIEWMADEKAKELATSDMATDTKLEALGKHLFGDAW
jgi:hypothetical protein